ncbi:MAG: patatin-like phospholipase family protein [Gemmatimonadaceae bacterium]|nr:patatin-like phospholipase family protein [Gemmatimonadaceae bacterium]
MSAAPPPRIGLVLGGGGLKGFAHLGVLAVLERLGLRPTMVAGSSIGALVATAYAAGTPLALMEQRALALTRKQLFRVNTAAIARAGLRAPSFYAPEPLAALIAGVVPPARFDELRMPLLVNTVDLERGVQVAWGSPGFTDAPLREAVYASCALPGFFPPGKVNGRTCVDGGTCDNLPVTFAAQGVDLLVAVDVGNSEIQLASDILTAGLGSIFMRSATLMMRTLQGWPLREWDGPPMLLIRPRVSQYGWFNFDKIPTLIAAGEQAAQEALPDLQHALHAGRGIWPRRPVQVEVVRERCTGCGMCVALAPHAMERDEGGKAIPKRAVFDWSPADADFVSQCPTGAIVARRVA